MALVRSSLVSSISGSIGGTTYARNRGGAYARNRTVPINPNSGSQVRARTSLGFWSTSWSLSLTSGQRSAWNAYAEAITSLNRLGESIVLTGQQTYVRSNTMLDLVGEAGVVDPPGVLSPDIVVDVLPVYDVSTPAVAVTITTDIVGFLSVFTGPPQTAGSLSTKQPFRFFGFEEADALGSNVLSAPPTGGFSRVYALGQFFTSRLVLVSTAGAVSNAVIVRSTVVA